MQRGGTPSAFDRYIATKMGTRAVHLLMDGVGGRVVGIRQNQIVDMDIDEALSMENQFDQQMYDEHSVIYNY